MFSEDLDKLVPPDFGAQTTIVIVEKSKPRINKIYEGAFRSKYNGEYMIVDTADINKQYADIDKYRYRLGFREGRSVSATSATPFKQYYDIYLLDRKTGKEYTETDLSGSLFEKHINAYLTKLENARRK